MPETLMIPTIHLNGTSKADLLYDLEQALHALREAQNLVGMTAPNGRDYYVQGPGAIEKAVAQHYARRERISAVIQELEAIAEAIDGGAAPAHTNGWRDENPKG